MNHNSAPSNFEDQNGVPNESYNMWQEAMKDVEFQGAKSNTLSAGQEIQSSPSAPEAKGKTSGVVEKFLSKIQSIKAIIQQKFGILNKEKLTEMTDDALVYVAKETVAAADQDGVRTATESAEIQEAVSSVVVQGAMEEAGMDLSAGGNPILELHQSPVQPDLMSSIDTMKNADAVLPSGESVAGLAVRTIERDKKWDLTKVSGQLGSNEGGWYERPTGERYYVKSYENPSQGQAEFVANAIYEKLGIKAVRSEIIQLDGREAIASPAIHGAAPASAESQASSADVQKGFVADAFLANWDVVGLVYDNIVQGEDGFYRIDNGGSMIFRAQGGDKSYFPDSIPELKTMRLPGRPAGKVFASITEEEIGRQARELVEKLSSEDIRAIVDESGLEGEDRDRILTGLLGRREYLVKTYGEVTANVAPESKERKPRMSVSDTIRRLSSQEMEQFGEMVLRPRSEIICDHDHIEGQRIDIINKIDRGVMEFRFKLRNPSEITIPKLDDQDGEAEVATASGAVLKRGKITYESASTDESRILCDACVFEKDGVKVFIAEPSSRKSGESISDTCNTSGEIRTAIGLVKMEAPASIDPEETERILGNILEKDLGIPDALGEVSEDAEKEYKEARYKWQHAITGELTPEQVEQAEKLELEEVFPGYSTLVEKDKHKEYLERYGKTVRAVHRLKTGDAKSIYRTLTQGLMCTTERFSRGIIKDGQTSDIDIDAGGADNVFTRIADEARRNAMDDTIVVFKPEVFDRTDWYTYDTDQFGSTDDPAFSTRLSPDTILLETTSSDRYPKFNEQMFRTGIGANYVESVLVDPQAYDGVVAELRSMGLEQIDGRSIEEIIVSRESQSPTDNLPEEYDPGLEKILQDIDKMSKQEDLQAVINGEKPYTSVEKIIELCEYADDFNTAFESITEATISQGKKDQITSDIAEYIKKEIDDDSLKVLAEGGMPEYLPDEDKRVLTYVKKTLGIDYGVLYKELIPSQSGTGNESVLSTDKNQDILPNSDSESEPTSKSVDDWM